MMTEEKIKQEEEKWAKEKEIEERKLKIQKEKNELKQKYIDLKHKQHVLSTTKFLIAFLFFNCTIIEIFTGWITLKSFDLATQTFMMPDFTPLVTLIGAVVSEVIGFAIYAIKSAKENTTGGIVYDSAMNEILNGNNVDDTLIGTTSHKDDYIPGESGTVG